MKMQNVLLFAVLLLAPLAFAAEAEIEVEEFEAEMAVLRPYST